MRFRTSVILLFTFAIGFFFVSVVIPHIVFITKRSEDIRYIFFSTHGRDYYHYTSIIRNGKEEGGILFRNQFSDPDRPRIIYFPVYKIFGWIANLVNIDQFVTYFYIRNSSSFVFILVLTLFIMQCYKHIFARFSAVVFSLSASSLWVLGQCGTIQCPVIIETYVRHHLNSLYRLLLLPPHHTMAVIFLMFNMILISRYKKHIVWLLLYAMSSVIMVFLHPYVALTWIFIFLIFLVLSALFNRNHIKEYVTLFFLTAFIILPVEYLTHRSYQTMVGVHALAVIFVPNSLPFVEYVKAFGFVIVPFVMSLFFVNKWKESILLRLCIAWTLAPLVGLFTPLMNNIMGFYRWFQVMPQIPAGIVSALIFYLMLKQKKIVGYLVFAVVSLFFVGNHLLFMYFQIPYMISENIPEFNEYRVFQGFQSVAHFLRTVTNASDVIVAGDRVAPMIPALTKAHVINGHEGNTDHFEERVSEVRIFFYGGYTEKEVKEFLKKYKATYIVFGSGSLPFDQSPYRSYAFLKEIYLQDTISVVKVLNY